MNLLRTAGTTILSLGFLCGSALAQGTVIAQHIGLNDPATEGFTLFGGSGASLVPVSGGPYGGAWAIDQTSLEPTEYRRILTSQEGDQMLTAGWMLSVTLQLTPPYYSSINGLFADAFVGGHDFGMSFGANSVGDPTIGIFNQVLTLTGAGGGYHNYQIRYDPAQQDASFWVDGSHVLDSLAAVSGIGTGELGWGVNQGGNRPLTANWAEITLAAIPEPSTVALIVFGGLFALRRRSRPYLLKALSRRSVNSRDL